jgi:hypothetical protein
VNEKLSLVRAAHVELEAVPFSRSITFSLTQSHCHTHTPLTPPHRHTATPPHRHTATPPHRHTAVNEKLLLVRAAHAELKTVPFSHAITFSHTNHLLHRHTAVNEKLSLVRAAHAELEGKAVRDAHTNANVVDTLKDKLRAFESRTYCNCSHLTPFRVAPERVHKSHFRCVM